MIALAPRPRGYKPARHSKFLAMLPTITSYAAFAFRQLAPEAREDAVAEVIAYAFVAYTRLAELGKTSIAFPTVLALYGIRRYWDGRRVGTKANRNDAYSNGSQRQRLGTPRDQRWQEALVDNTKSPVPDQVAFGIDFGEWLRTLNKRNRDIVFRLCQGDRPTELARKHNISRGRISQLRRALHEDWQAFQDDSSLGAISLCDANTSDARRANEKRIPVRRTTTDDALKEELLREAVAWDDLEDRIASMSDATQE